ncbi:DUF2278 family protein [Geodermatophilus sp. URMC 64]
MPLDRYGVLVGVLRRSFRDPPDEQGRWFHVNLEVDAPAGLHRCAVDVDSKMSAVGVQWKVLTLPAAALGPVPALAPGLHDLPRAPGSGALDYERHPALGPRAGCLLGGLVGGRETGWTSGSHLQAAEALETILVPERRALVFGEPFRTGLGVHNVHQNQGDPAGSQWWEENGIWQDGATLTERPDGRFDVFLSKFSTQATATDDDGHPRGTG